jgi:hypothetical protein
MDIKKLLFKYGDKAIFVVFLAIFLWSALKMVSSQNFGGNTIPPLGQAFVADPELMAESDSASLNRSITAPQYSDASNDIATDPVKLEPREGEKKCPACGWFSPKEAEVCGHCGYRWDRTPQKDNDKDRDGLPDDWELKYFKNLDQGPKDDPDGDGYNNKEEYEAGTDPTDPKSIPQPFSIAEISKEPVDILFKGYIVHEGGDSEKPDTINWAIEINWGRNTQTKIIQYGGYFHGYKLYPVKKEVERVFNEKLNDWVVTDIWYLTIQKKGRKEIIARKNTEVREQELYVKFRVNSGNQKGQVTDKLYDGDKFIVNSDEFKIQTVSETQVIVWDKNNNLLTIKKGQ